MAEYRLTTIKAKADRFRALHESGIFVMPCAWDPLSALLFARAGFAALGTTSGGVNWSHGRPDYVYGVSRDEMLSSYGEIADATHLPVSGDLENGYSDDPTAVADCIRRSIEKGMVGGSIEDHSSTEPTGLVSKELAVEKIEAAREAADQSGVQFTITGRAEAMYTDMANALEEAVERANLYAAAGADCIFIPGLDNLDTIAEVTAAIGAPVSIGLGAEGYKFTLSELADAGVRRVSTGGAVPRAVYAEIDRISRQMLSGDFSFGAHMMSDVEVEKMFEPTEPDPIAANQNH